MASIFERTPTNFFGWIIIVLLIILVILNAYQNGFISDMKVSSMDDPGAARRYIEINGVSQDSRQLAAINKGTSGMTGSRDIPVFFQDYDYDMSRSAKGLVNAREGLDGTKRRINEMENVGHN